MSLREMDIQSIVVGGGPVASLVVLRTRTRRKGESSLQLPIRIGTFEANAISMGVPPQTTSRPMTHDLLCSVISSLGGESICVRIVSVRGTTFFAQLELAPAVGEHVFVDARPSDAIAVAVREGLPIYVEDSVLETAALPDFRSVERDEEAHELEEFHAFVEGLSPEDFNVTPEGHTEE